MLWKGPWNASSATKVRSAQWKLPKGLISSEDRHPDDAVEIVAAVGVQEASESLHRIGDICRQRIVDRVQWIRPSHR